MKTNLCTASDSYKSSHFLQFPPNTTKTHYYLESRGGEGDNLLFFGLQYILTEYFKNVPTIPEVKEANNFWKLHGLPFNEEGWKDISRIGYLPLKVIAPPEGSIVPIGKALITVENTDDRFPWLPGWMETLLMQIWFPTTVCTRSYRCKQVIKRYLENTGDITGLPFKLHDFGFRGVSSYESAMIGAMSHLVNFMGTDTTAGILGAMKYYNADMCGYSIPASEHSTTTAAWGREGEIEAYRNMLDQFAKPGSLVAVVSDSYDYWNALKIWGIELKQQVIDSGATVIIRPDSGDATEVIPRTAQELDKYFGSTVNGKGFKVLNHVRIIQGDGINNEHNIDHILLELMKTGYSADNVAFGMGGGLCQQVNRDTFKFAMKCSAVKINGEWNGVCKSPIDAPWKSSKAGKQSIENGRIVFENGNILINDDFNTVRERSNV
mgnify:CR=1 FL=1